MSELFTLGNFTLNSGARSNWKIECDSLTVADWRALAIITKQLIGHFRAVYGVPRGGIPLRDELVKHLTDSVGTDILICDDVLTTGGSMNRFRDDLMKESGIISNRIKGVVVFARGACPDWVEPIFQLPKKLWLTK